MKNFFIGFYHLPYSVTIVNRELLSQLPTKKFKFMYSGNGIKRRLNAYWNIFFSKKIIISGIFLSTSEIKLIKILGKKFIYLMHGSYFMENGIKHKTESLVLEYANKIVSVSAVHAEMIKQEFPQYSDKVVNWFNGINWGDVEHIRISFEPSMKDEKKIILFGGGRFMKGNLAVCEAVEQLNAEKNLDLHVDVYGDYSETDLSPEIKKISCVNYKAIIPHERINYELAKANLFIANSKFETFNIALIDAIGVGCNVLFSKNVGAKDIIPDKKEEDIINDVDDIEELKSKIQFILSNPNNERLYNSIDKKDTSWENRAKQIEEILTSI